jgi:hypothetical protein
MATIAEIRSKYPQYQDLSDMDLAGALYRKYYSDMDPGVFAQKIGLEAPAPKKSELPAETPYPEPNVGRKGFMKPDDRFNADLGTTTLQGSLLNFSDEILSGIEAPIDAAIGAVTGKGPTNLSEAYDQALAYNRAKLEATREQRPGAALATEIGGALMTGKVPAGMVVKGGNLLSKAGRGAAIGATYGGVAGFGAGEGADDRLGEALSGAQVGALVGGAVPPVLDRAGRLVVNALSNRSTAQAAQDFAQVGVRPTVGAVTNNRGVQLLEQGIANTPGGASPMARVMTRQAQDIEDATGRLVQRIGQPQTGQGAGDIIRDAASKAAKRFESRQEELYDRAYRVIGGDTRMTTPNVQAMLSKLEDEKIYAEGMRDEVLLPVLARVGRIAEAGLGGVPFDVVRKTRTDIGRMLKVKPVAMTDSAGMDYMRQLYGALSEDIKATAKAIGPQAEHALAVADRYTRFNLTMNQPLWQKMQNLDAGEKAFNAALSGSKDGGSTLARLRRNFTPDEWDTVAATVLDRMGNARPGQRGVIDPAQEMLPSFSTNSFLTNWGKLAPEAKQALFGGKRYGEVRQSLDTLVRVMSRAQAGQKLGNPSGTARNVMTGGALTLAGQRLFSGDMIGAAGVLAASHVAPYITAKMITSPLVVRSFARVAAARNPEQSEKALNMLLLAVERDPDLREDAAQLRQRLLGAPSPERPSGLWTMTRETQPTARVQ